MEEKSGTSLHHAVTAEQWDEVLLELQQGADVNAVDDNSCTPLHLAIEHGAPAHIVTRLISKENVNIHHGVICQLICTDSMDKQGYDCCTALHLAVERQQWEIARCLMEHGADFNIARIDKATPLHLAIRWGAPVDICTELITSENVNMQDRFGFTPLHWAVGTEYKNWSFVSVLIQHGADINLCDIDDDTPLQVVVAAEEEIPPLEIFMQLISERNINHLDLYGMSVLHQVQEYQKWELVPVLLQHGADVNLVDEECEKTPLHLSIEYDAPTDIVIQLMSAQNINMVDGNGHTPLHRAASEQTWEQVTVLLQHGADPTKLGGFRQKLALKDLCILTVRSHMTARTDEALENLELPRDHMPEMKMKGIIQQFVAWWKHRMVVQDSDGTQ